MKQISHHPYHMFRIRVHIKSQFSKEYCSATILFTSRSFPMLIRQTLYRALILLLFCSCSKRETEVLQLVSPPPSGIVARDAPIILTFSRAIVSSDSTNQWTTTPYVRFTPDIPGRFTWRDTST